VSVVSKVSELGNVGGVCSVRSQEYEISQESESFQESERFQ
jgi:hypothetical protein